MMMRFGKEAGSAQESRIGLTADCYRTKNHESVDDDPA